MKQKLILPSFQGQADSTNKGRVLGYRCPLPQLLRAASHHEVWVLLVPCVHWQHDLGRLAGFGRGGQGVKLVFSSFEKEEEREPLF